MRECQGRAPQGKCSTGLLSFPSPSRDAQQVSTKPLLVAVSGKESPGLLQTLVPTPTCQGSPPRWLTFYKALSTWKIPFNPLPKDTRGQGCLFPFCGLGDRGSQKLSNKDQGHTGVVSGVAQIWPGRGLTSQLSATLQRGSHSPISCHPEQSHEPGIIKPILLMGN